ncbi:hypothetical protein FC90_GL001743 [Latilactobacillus graminis DSM 20719]|uniref:Two component regulator three Y domain-containing protein n=2 Tax=Latilactobacillus graminis TaxID=60519 RepID=A0AA89L023_9LACO|nr:hypothetical protein FC90_GL001743 [Latilactobacillus graminis DSM 20719]
MRYYFQMQSRTKKRKQLKLHYILKKTSAVNAPLIVIFSAFPRTGYEATYNYLKTLEGIPAHRLYILDRFGAQKRGTYYLANNGDFTLRSMVQELIRDIKIQVGTQRLICVGSSKGGYAALYYGHLMGAECVIAGAPQYYLGNYLSDQPLKKPILEGVMGNSCQSSIDFLNHLLPDLITQTPTLKMIYLHYSDQEHTYHEHIQTLIELLTKKEQPLNLNVAHYNDHQAVRHYFPRYLQTSLLSLQLGTKKK